MPLPQTSSELIGTFVEAVLFGVYWTIFWDCMKVLWSRGLKTGAAWYLFLTATSLFALVTAHLVVDIDRNIDAFISSSPDPHFADKYYAKFSAFKDVFKSALYTTATLLADAFILYRTFIVWGGSYLITIVPFLLFLADIAIGILWTYTVSLVPTGANIFINELSTRIKIFYTITMCLNILCTALISYKIWRIQSDMTNYSTRRDNRLTRVIAIIVESGAVYSLLLIILISLWTTSSPVMYIFLNPVWF
jgi:hypothetical protein